MFSSSVRFRTSRHLRRFPFDQKFRFEISKISRGKWNSKSGNFPDGYTSLGGPSRSIQFWTEIYDRELLQTEIFSNGTVTSDQNGPTEKAVHLGRWTFFSENFPVGQNRSIQFRTGISGKFWLNGKRPL